MPMLNTGGNSKTEITEVKLQLEQINSEKYDKVTLYENVLKFYANEVELTSITLPSFEGGGQNAKEIELQKSETHIQWRYIGEELWRDLVALNDIKGEQGIPGVKGDKGDPGVKGEKGQDGATPNLVIGTVTTLASNQQASANITGTTPNLVLNLGIPKGEQGESHISVLSTSMTAVDYYNLPNGLYIVSKNINLGQTDNCSVSNGIEFPTTWLWSGEFIQVVDKVIYNISTGLCSGLNEQGKIKYQQTISNSYVGSMDKYALKTELHTHTNKSSLDKITEQKMSSWDNKSDFSGSYNDLTDIPVTFTPASHNHPATEITTDTNHQFVTEEDKVKWTNTVGGYRVWVGTQVEYDDITAKDSHTLYFIKEG